ncbi:CIC11C00000002284 [Sungouiella intermedia]|uniref:[acyl-carrier-protein] S-malonyltransferase n=1 Tax=Sungouiella intermedia TaxID=45354 RepID=A0A1L0BX45_9ASCO|nr:CIC11C00000002284 [[Candida] intermedia]
MLLLIRRASTFAVACPGQGIIVRGCLNALKSHQHLFQKSLDCVDETLGCNFSSHLLDSPSSTPDSWSQSTANAQPAIVASTYVLYSLFKELHGIDLARDSRVSYLMGHSLGEYTALLLGGVLTLPQAIAVVRKRGLFMEQLVQQKKYAMTVLVFKPAEFDRVVDIAKEHGILACINNSTQVLISGEPEQLQKAVDVINLPKKRILKQAQLPVTIPFHNNVLSPMDDQLAALVTDESRPSKPVISNLTGQPCENYPFSNTVKSNSLPVQWKKSMEFLIEQGVSQIVNLGPGNAVDAINGRFKVHNWPLKGLEDFDKLAEALRAE